MGLPEYMRGYRALDKEISLIKDRKYRTLNNLFLEVDELKKLNKNQLINYNFNLLEINLKKSLLYTIIIFSIIGLISCVIYVVLSSIITLKK